MMPAIEGVRSGSSAVIDGRFFGQRRLVWLFGLAGVPKGAPAFFSSAVSVKRFDLIGSSPRLLVKRVAASESEIHCAADQAP